MRIAIGESLILEVRTGTPVHAIVEFARARGHNLSHELWCGDIRLDQAHPAGQWPLVGYPKITSQESHSCAPARGTQLVVVTGPDAGKIVHTKTGLIGRSSGDNALQDPWLSRTHARLRTQPDIAIRDHGSRNGTSVLRDGKRTQIWRWRWRKLRTRDLIHAGRTYLYLPDSPDIPTKENTLKERPKWATVAASAGGGIALGAITGRWIFALAGLAYPAVTMGIWWWNTRHAGVESVMSPLIPEQGPINWNQAVCIVGEPRKSAGFARAVVLNRGRQPPAGGFFEPWMRILAPATTQDGHLRLAEHSASWDDVTVQAKEEGFSVSSGDASITIPTLHVTAEVAEAWARRIHSSRTSTLPDALTWGDIADAKHPRTGLSAVIGSSETGPFALDLDRDGPHVLVAGTTGSGKSEFLETLVMSLTAHYPPTRLSLAILDFKGGAMAQRCADLPHLAGTVSDLDPALGRRALAAIAQEIVERKRRLSVAGFASMSQWESVGDAPARLLIIADEYQEIAASNSSFLPDLARLAAQGRTLGLHFVLATQRPAGAVTPEIRANIGTTVALRVASETESRDLVGSTDAAHISAAYPGRAIVTCGTTRTTVQIARPTSHVTPAVQEVGISDNCDVDRPLSATATSGATVAPLWHPPLPIRISPTDLSGKEEEGICFGTWDDITTRTQGTASWNPQTGSLVIAGPTHSGRTTALYALAAGCSASSWTPVWLPSDARLAARTIEKVIKKNDHVLLVDNTEQLLEALTNHARGTGADGLATLMQQGRVACTMSVASGGRIARHRRATVVLGALEDHEAALWSSPPRNLTSSPPGRGRWRESGTWKEVQIAHAEAMEIPDLVIPLPSPLLRSDLKSRDSSDTRQAVAVAGDTAQPWRPDPTAPVVVVGTPGQERTHISMLMRNCAQGVTEVSSVFNVTTVQRTDATVVVINPSPADIRELRHGHEAGVVETREIPYRAVVLTPEKVMAAQFFAPEG